MVMFKKIRNEILHSDETGKWKIAIILKTANGRAQRRNFGPAGIVSCMGGTFDP